MTTDYFVTTITASIQLPSLVLDAYPLLVLLECDEIVLGLKFSIGEACVHAGAYETSLSKRYKGTPMGVTRSFYNQITLRLQIPSGYPVNVKIFHNGSLQCTGVRCVDHFPSVVTAVMTVLQRCALRTKNVMVSHDENERCLYRPHHMPGVELLLAGERIIGYKEEGCYVIGKSRYRWNSDLSLYESLVRTDARDLLDGSGQKVGTLLYVYLVPKRQFNTYLDTKRVFDRESKSYDVFVGEKRPYRVGYIYCSMTRPVSIEKKLANQAVTVTCPEFCTVTDNAIIQIHCINAGFAVPHHFNLVKYCDFLENTGHLCLYRPQTYAALRLKIDDVTFLIFHSGKIILTGAKSMAHLDRYHQWYLDHTLHNGQNYVTYDRSVRARVPGSASV